MASTNKTENLNLSQFLAADKPGWLTDYNNDMQKIDGAVGAAEAALENKANKGPREIFSGSLEVGAYQTIDPDLLKEFNMFSAFIVGNPYALIGARNGSNIVLYGSYYYSPNNSFNHYNVIISITDFGIQYTQSSAIGSFSGGSNGPITSSALNLMKLIGIA